MVGRIHLKQGGAWKEPSHIFVKTGGLWKDPLGGWKKVSGTWQQFYPQPSIPVPTLDLNFIAMSATGVLDPRITFSRTSLATYFGSDGLLKYAAHNVAWPSEDFTHANWAKANGATVTANAATAPDSTVTADQLNHVTTGTVNGGTLNFSIFTLLADRIICSVYAKSGSKNWLVLAALTSPTAARNCYFNLAAGVVGTRGTDWISSGIQNVGGGWYRCWGVIATTSLTLMSLRVGEVNASMQCTSPGDIFLWGAQLEYVTTETAPRTYLPTTTAAYHAPRFDYDPVTHVPLGLLIEESRQNYSVFSEDFAAAQWTKVGLIVTADQIAAPTGAVNADELMASASPSQIQRSLSSDVADGLVYVVSVYAKKGTSDWFYIYMNTLIDSPKAYFNLATGTVGTVDALIAGATIQNIGNGWYRCSARRVAPTSGTEFAWFGICDANGSTTVTVGKTVYLWGAHSEATPSGVGSSYIPTGASSGARAADIATMTGTNFSSWYNQSAGTFVAGFDLIAAVGTRGILTADNNSVTEMIQLYGSGADPKVTIIDNSVVQADLDVGTIAANIVYKLGAAYAANDIAACLNGGSVVIDTVATLPTPTQLQIGNERSSPVNFLTGHLRRIRFWNAAVTDTDLQILTAADPPMAVTIVSTSFSITENTTSVGMIVAASDLPVTWSLTGGADLSKFTIGAASGALTFNTAPDFEAPTDADANNVYVVQVRASDGITSDTKTINVTVFNDAPSYVNSGGRGDRTSLITITTTATLAGTGGITNLIDGLYATTMWFNGGQTGREVKFDFGVARVITEAKWYQSATGDQGVWKWQGSNDNSIYTDIGGTFTLGSSATTVITTLSANTTGYRYYKMLQVSGTTTSSPNLGEIEFKIATT